MKTVLILILLTSVTTAFAGDERRSSDVNVRLVLVSSNPPAPTQNVQYGEVDEGLELNLGELEQLLLFLYIEKARERGILDDNEILSFLPEINNQNQAIFDAALEELILNPNYWVNITHLIENHQDVLQQASFFDEDVSTERQIQFWTGRREELESPIQPQIYQQRSAPTLV